MEQRETDLIKNRCPICSNLEQRLMEARKDPHRQYMPILQQATELESQGRIELLAGDCRLEEAGDVLTAEQHYTVCHYLRCKSCGTVYFVGACIRGTPVYRRAKDLKEENLPVRLWGREGSLFQKNSVR